MKTQETHPHDSRRRFSRTAFTLAELMIAAGLLSIAVAGGVYLNLVGLRYGIFTRTKISAAAEARKALTRVRDDVRSAKMLAIGYGGGLSFTNAATNQVQQGNAIQVYPTMSTNNFVRYYVDASDHTLKRKQSGNSAASEVIAKYVTNQIAFCSQDFTGRTLTNAQDNRVIQITLDFYQWEFAILNQGGGSMQDCYRVQSRVSRRFIP